MDKQEYLRLLSQASVNDTSKFCAVPLERPKSKGRPPKYYRLLPEKEKVVESTVRRILPSAIADSVRPTGSRLARFYGLPKTHKRQLAMRPILSATGTYNYALAKWLDAMLKPLSVNEHTITDIFAFTNEIRGVKGARSRYFSPFKINPGEILVSYDVSSLFTNVPLDETIDILARKAFENNWFNDTYDLNLTRTDLVDLMHVATKGQLFQFDGVLYEQTDGVAMGSPLGPLLANVFMCSIEMSLKSQGKLPEFYRRYVDDTLVRMPDLAAATQFLDTLNHAHSAVCFTMEVEKNGMLPFLGVQLLNRAPCVETKVYVKPTNTGLLLHYHSHVDSRYKHGLLVTMLDRAHRLSSCWAHFSEECERLREVFRKLRYPNHLIDSVINRFITSRVAVDQPKQHTDDAIRIVIPYKDQDAAVSVKRQLRDLSSKVQKTIQPVFTSRKLKQDLSLREPKPNIVTQQCVVYLFKCDLCDAGYVGYTKGHLHTRVEGHRPKASSIYRHYCKEHSTAVLNNFLARFNIGGLIASR
ncbi:uncharacterized protein [Montipora capricornis]|uniref:uncharacterized protein n=1 Tax=Montipora capricornis TaxID=246305 RepID=UPI0035F1B063